ncbi:hypothetical protein DKX38_008324 [Salix brachista]|uniref:Uncharacterized protein n=1 Tax=Salix brachista TaxID=2182728 RepID=A0A5N5MQH3_9ROSI|nr:hypothetical protein DKX38_008324 [Salix brachista]
MEERPNILVNTHHYLLSAIRLIDPLTGSMKTRDHRTSERAMTLASHVQIVKDHHPIPSGSLFNLSPMVIVDDNKKPRVFKQLLNQSVISPCACEHREGDGDDDDDGVDVAPAA